MTQTTFSRPLAGLSRWGFGGSRFHDYLKILLIGSGARVIGLASQFLVLLILSHVLSKGTFGDLMTAFGFYRLASVALGVGGSLVLLFHISRHPDNKDAEIKLHRYAALLGAGVSALVAVVGFLAAGTIAKMLGKPGLEVWFHELAPFAVFNTLLIVSTGALEGRSRVSESIALCEVAPNLVRVAALPLIGWLHLPDVYVAHVLTLSVIVPWLWPAQRLRDRSVTGMQPWTAWDHNYCAKSVVAMLFANQLGAVDILVGGALFSSDIVADYAVASRIAGLFTFLQLAVLKRFAPRAGRLIETGETGLLRQEVELCRQLMIALAALSICGILLMAPFVLPLFGNYHSALYLLYWLAIPAYVGAFYATSDRLLTIAGQATVTLLFNGLSFLVLITLPFVAAPWIGVIAIPIAMILSTLVFNLIITARVKKMFGIRTIRWPDGAFIAVGAIALAAGAMTGTTLAGIAACGIFAAIGLYFASSVMGWRSGRPTQRYAETL
jgi:O-antigen/teichoic acid export membrane protein